MTQDTFSNQFQTYGDIFLYISNQVGTPTYINTICVLMYVYSVHMKYILCIHTHTHTHYTHTDSCT